MDIPKTKKIDMGILLKNNKMPMKPDEDMRNLDVSFETFLNYTFIICAVFLTMGIEFFITILKILYDSLKNGFVFENFKSENIWRKVNRSIRRRKY